MLQGPQTPLLLRLPRLALHISFLLIMAFLPFLPATPHFCIVVNFCTANQPSLSPPCLVANTHTLQ